MVVGHTSTNVVKNNNNANYKNTADVIFRMVYYFINNIFVECGGVIFQQVVGISMGTNCAPLLADLFYFLMRPSLLRHSLNVANDI